MGLEPYSTVRGSRRSLIASVAVVATAVAGCAGTTETDTGTAADGDALTVVVTTSIWGDVVERSYGDLVDVEVLMPDNADPHHFAPSVKQAASLENADLIVANGAGLEVGLTSAIEAAESSGVAVFTVADHVDTLPIDDGPIDDGPIGDGPIGDDHADQDDGADDDDHAGGDGRDPHIWYDPTLVASAVEALGTELESIGVDGARERSTDYIDELGQLDTDISAQVASIPAEHRKLVTNHDAFEYFAHRYGLEVVTTVIGSVTTDAEPSAVALERVAETINSSGVRAVFVESNESRRLAEAVVDETGSDIEVVELVTDGLGDTGSYVEMMTTNSNRIATALA